MDTLNALRVTPTRTVEQWGNDLVYGLGGMQEALDNDDIKTALSCIEDLRNDLDRLRLVLEPLVEEEG